MKLTYNQMSCISYILENERNHFEEFLCTLDGKEKEIADKFISLEKIEGIKIDKETEKLLEGHIYGLAVLAINGL